MLEVSDAAWHGLTLELDQGCSETTFGLAASRLARSFGAVGLD